MIFIVRSFLAAAVSRGINGAPSIARQECFMLSLAEQCPAFQKLCRYFLTLTENKKPGRERLGFLFFT
jgi:hypothetical protein